ncbi:hypothetical protein V1511DRAFT_493283 [Dipodascopsis uninucleata]
MNIGGRYLLNAGHASPSGLLYPLKVSWSSSIRPELIRAKVFTRQPSSSDTTSVSYKYNIFGKISQRSLTTVSNAQGAFTLLNRSFSGLHTGGEIPRTRLGISRDDIPGIRKRQLSSYYGQSPDDEYLFWRSQARNSKDLLSVASETVKRKGLTERTRWVLFPQLWALVIFGGCYLGIVFLTPMEEWGAIHAVCNFTSLEAFIGFKTDLEVVSSYLQLLIAHMLDPHRTETISNPEEATFDWDKVWENMLPSVSLAGACFAYYILKRYGPDSVRALFVRFGYVRSDIYSATSGWRTPDSPYLSLLISGFSHRNPHHLFASVGLLIFASSCVTLYSSEYNTYVLFLGGTLCGSIASMFLSALFKRPPVVTLGSDPASYAMLAFLCTYLYSEDTFKFIGGQREVGLRHTEIDENSLRRAIFTVKSGLQQYDPNNQRNFAMKVSSPLISSQESGEVERGSDIILVLNGDKKSPNEKSNLLFVQCHPPPANAVSSGIILLGLTLATLNVASFFMIGSRILVADFAANIGGLLFGSLTGLGVRDKYDGVKTVIAVVPESMTSAISGHEKSSAHGDSGKADSGQPQESLSNFTAEPSESTSKSESTNTSTPGDEALASFGDSQFDDDVDDDDSKNN